MAVHGPPADTKTYHQQVQQTRQSLNTVDDSTLVGLTSLGIGQIQALKQEIAEIFPSSNLPAFLLQGLIQIEDRSLSTERINEDLALLFRGSKQISLYSILAAPAIVVYGYQKLLSLAGKNVESAFPNGIWQFYTEFGLRQDAARHSVEAIGLHQACPDANDVDAATSWVYAAMLLLHSYDDLLDTTWNEHRSIRSLHDVLNDYARSHKGKRPSARKKAEAYDQDVADMVAALVRDYKLEHVQKNWLAQRPYGTPEHTPPHEYATYRREQFQAFLDKAMRFLPHDLRDAWEQHHASVRTTDLPAFQQQMTILMTLQPESYQDRRVPISLHRAQVGFIVHDAYHLLDACARDDDGTLLVFASKDSADTNGVPLPLTEGRDGKLSDRSRKPVTIDRRGNVWVGDSWKGYIHPPALKMVKGQVQSLLRQAKQDKKPDAADTSADMLLAHSPREQQESLRKQLSKDTQRALENMRYAPLLINWTMHNAAQSLDTIRQTHRGCGDHALTLIRTERSMVFDMSHICFDGIWGMEIAEVTTDMATAFYPLVVKSPASRGHTVEPVRFTSTPSFLSAAKEVSASFLIESGAETQVIDLEALNRMRQKLKKIELSLTVNDVLIMARCLYALTYRPGKRAQQALKTLASIEGGADIQQVFETHLEEQRAINPSLLIPMDASAVDPKERIFPATFRNPLHDMPNRIVACVDMVQHLKKQRDDDLVQTFEAERRELYSDLKTFSALLQTFRDITMRGESFSLAAMRLLAHLPKPLQNLMDMIPQRIDILNEIIKGSEVFSNVGQVSPHSSITRFFSSRDDGDTKLLIWGIMSDAHGQVLVTLRDFRPHVPLLVQAGHPDLARLLTQDYLDGYGVETNALVRHIQRIFSYKA